MKKPIIGKVYANWCGHCRLLAPEWKKLKGILPKNRVQIVDIEESETNKRTAFEKQHPNLSISGYPTIFKIHTNRHIEYYSGPRDAVSMKKWVLEKRKNTQKSRTFRNNKTRKNWYELF